MKHDDNEKQKLTRSALACLIVLRVRHGFEKTILSAATRHEATSSSSESLASKPTPKEGEKVKGKGESVSVAQKHSYPSTPIITPILISHGLAKDLNT